MDVMNPRALETDCSGAVAVGWDFVGLLLTTKECPHHTPMSFGNRCPPSNRFQRLQLPLDGLLKSIVAEEKRLQ